MSQCIRQFNPISQLNDVQNLSECWATVIRCEGATLKVFNVSCEIKYVQNKKNVVHYFWDNSHTVFQRYVTNYVNRHCYVIFVHSFVMMIDS